MTSSLIFLDRVMETTAVTSTAPYKLNGPVLGYQAFSNIGDGNTCYYAAWDGLSNWEVGLGTYTLATTTLARTTIEASSNNGSPVSWPLPNTKYIWLDFPAATIAALSSGTLGLPLVGQGAGVPSIYAALPLGSGGVTGVLPVANGGTGQTGNVRTITSGSTVTALATDTLIITNLASAGTLAGTLPATSTCDGLELSVSDFNGNCSLSTWLADASDTNGIQSQSSIQNSAFQNFKIKARHALLGWVIIT